MNYGTEYATCRNCGHPVGLIVSERDVWGHIVPGRTTLPRGCRAASFDRLGDWDDNLLQSWKARPVEGTKSDKPTEEIERIIRENEPKVTSPDGRDWTWEQVQSWVISLSIRNALEMFHGGGAMDPDNPDSDEGFITDRQMKALNIVIRQTVSEEVKRLEYPSQNVEHILWTLAYINNYMEAPGSDELRVAYERIKNGEFDLPGFIPDCTRSEPGA
jgi:hypothetical protein